jgi:hypothetical protein
MGVHATVRLVAMDEGAARVVLFGYRIADATLRAAAGKNQIAVDRR